MTTDFESTLQDGVFAVQKFEEAVRNLDPSPLSTEDIVWIQARFRGLEAQVESLTRENTRLRQAVAQRDIRLAAIQQKRLDI